MAARPSTAGDAMFDLARSTIETRFALRRHEIAAVLRDTSGRTFVGINLKAEVGRANVCAEGAALAQAVLAGSGDLVELCVVHKVSAAADSELRIVPPCGVCRELLVSYAPQVVVRIPGDAGRTATLAELLPHRYEQVGDQSERPVIEMRKG